MQNRDKNDENIGLEICCSMVPSVDLAINPIVPPYYACM